MENHDPPDSDNPQAVAATKKPDSTLVNGEQTYGAKESQNVPGFDHNQTSVTTQSSHSLEPDQPQPPKETRDGDVLEHARVTGDSNNVASARRNGDALPERNGDISTGENGIDGAGQTSKILSQPESTTSVAQRSISGTDLTAVFSGRSSANSTSDQDDEDSDGSESSHPGSLRNQISPSQNGTTGSSQYLSPEHNRAPYPALQNGASRSLSGQASSSSAYPNSPPPPYESITRPSSTSYGYFPGSTAAPSGYGAFPGSQAPPSRAPAAPSNYGAFPGSQPAQQTASSYGSWPGTHSFGSFPGSQSYGAFPGSSQPTAQTESTSANKTNHHAGSFGVSDGVNQPNPTEPAHLAPQTGPKPMTEAERLTHHLQTRWDGDEPVEYQGRPKDRSQEEGGESISHLAGQWDEGDRGGGRAHAQKAWRAAITYGGMYEYDPNADETRDPEMQALFEQADLPLFRKRGPTNRPGRGRGGWRRLLKGTTHENVGKREPVSRARGVGTARPRARTQKYVDPGKEFKHFLAKANKAYVDNNLPAASDFARQAIQANPEVFQAYALLSEILTQLGDADSAVNTMKMAAVVARTVDVWTMTADKILEHAGEDRSREMLKDAVDCYSEALKIGAAFKDKPELEFDLRVAKLELYREMGDSRGSRQECKQILARFPERTEFCREYAVLCAKWGDKNEVAKARDAYEKAFEIYKDHDTFGDPNDHIDRLSHLNIYLELVNLLGDYEEGLKKGKQLARWVLGRKDEAWWDKYHQTDCEFDSQNERRRQIGEWQQGRASRDMSKYGDGLPVEIKVRMGLIRLKMGVHCYQEAVAHFKHLLEFVDSPEDYCDLFKEAAEALRERHFFAEAAKFFDPVRTMPNAGDTEKVELDVWFHFGVCYEILGRRDDAIACFETVASQHKGDSYVKACAKLAKLYEDTGETDKARYLANEVIKLNRRDLLHDAKLRMIPAADPSYIRPASLPFEVTYAVAKPKQSPDPPSGGPSKAPLRQLLPAGTVWPPLSTEATFAASLAAKAEARLREEMGWDMTAAPGSLDTHMSMPVTNASPSPTDARPGSPHTQGPAQAGIELPKPRKNKRTNKGKSALSLLCGDLAGEDDEDDETDLPQPKAKRPRTNKETTMSKAAAEHARRYQHIADANDRALANLETCQRLTATMKDGKDEAAVAEWATAARSLLETFASMKVFFPAGVAVSKAVDPDDPTNTLNDKKNRADLTGPQEFLKISYADWHRVFVDLTLYHAANGEQERCYQMLQGILFTATPFQKSDFEWINFATAIQCGLTFNDSQYLIEIARKLAADSDHRSLEAAQLFAGLNRFPYGSNWFAAGPTQKWMLRLVKMFDYMAMTPDMRSQIDWSAQGMSLVRRGDMVDWDPNKVTEPDPQILMTYGHIVSQSNHSHSAIPYYYRALAVQPDNPCINLSIATMWVQNSMKRQTENRQLGITEGLAFLNRYYDLRVASGRACHIQEAEYNVARMWHYLGLTHLAIPAYEKVLALSGKVQADRTEEDGPLTQDVEDFAKEAAFALQGIYNLVGNHAAATAITEEWLVF